MENNVRLYHSLGPYVGSAVYQKISMEANAIRRQSCIVEKGYAKFLTCEMWSSSAPDPLD